MKEEEGADGALIAETPQEIDSRQFMMLLLALTGELRRYGDDTRPATGSAVRRRAVNKEDMFALRRNEKNCSIK